VWQPNDNLTLVTTKFGASPRDITTANAKYFGQNFIAATNFPVFIPVKNLSSLSESYSSIERKRSKSFSHYHFH